MAGKERLVFLDAGTVGEVPFAPLRALGRFRAHPFTPKAAMARRLRGATIAITNKCPFDAALISQLPALRAVCVTATGVNNVDLEAARRKSVAVMNVAGYSTESVVQLTFAFILALAGRLFEYARAGRDGTWSRSPFFTVHLGPIREVAGKTLGIVGYGTIGRRVGQVAKALGMNVLAAAIPGRGYAGGRRTPFAEVVRKADFLTIHAPLSPLTRGLIGAGVIRKMKPGAFLVNMARGGIVDERALRRALERGRLAGAAADVLTEEPPSRGHVLLGAPRLVLTPHVGWASLEARLRLMDETVRNIRAFLKGRPRNRVV